MHTTVYRSLLRPVSSVTLPDYGDLEWEFVEAPPEIAHRRPDLPRSLWRYGTFRTSRPLTPDELRHFSIEAIE